MQYPFITPQVIFIIQQAIHHLTTDYSLNKQLFTQQAIVISQQATFIAQKAIFICQQFISYPCVLFSWPDFHVLEDGTYDGMNSNSSSFFFCSWKSYHHFEPLYTHTPIYAYKIIWLRQLDGRDHFQTILISLRRRLLHEVKILYTVEAHISLGHHFVVFRPKIISLAFNFVILLFLVFINTWVKSLSGI